MTSDEQLMDEPRSAEQQAEEDDLEASLRGLSMLAAGRLPLEELLIRVARYAVQAIPGADGAGLTLIREHRIDNVVATADFVAEVDAVQYGIGEGPCVTAARDGVTVISGALGTDPRWPGFGARIARTGVHSVVSLPLLTSDEVIGAMNVYAFAEDAFDERAAELGELFAAPAAVAAQHAGVLEEARRLADRLQAALADQVIIERAVGIVMSRSGIDDAEALARLTTLSRNERVKLVQLARNLVDEAVRWGRAER